MTIGDWIEGVLVLCPCKHLLISVSGGVSAFIVSGSRGFIVFIQVVFVGVFAGLILAPAVTDLIHSSTIWFDLNIPITDNLKDGVVGMVSVASWNLLLIIQKLSGVLFGKFVKGG